MKNIRTLASHSRPSSSANCAPYDKKKSRKTNGEARVKKQPQSKKPNIRPPGEKLRKTPIMGQAVKYCNDKGTRHHENSNHVHYETCGKNQKYSKEDCSKETQEECRTKYLTGGAVRMGHRGRMSSISDSSTHRQRRSRTKSAKSKMSSDGGDSMMGKSSKEQCSKMSASRSAPSSSPKMSVSSLAQRMSRCYEIKQAARRNECTRKPCWQHGKYVRDECGSGIVPVALNIKPGRNKWCHTPLTLYQATIGELARKLLCREISVPRDINGEPPSNIAEYILPPCRGYYRKYDCLRPCEEEYAVMRGGIKQYRSRVQRYWEPCLSKEQKHKLDVNEYAPQNVFLAMKLRRKNNVTDDIQCW